MMVQHKHSWTPEFACQFDCRLCHRAILPLLPGGCSCTRGRAGSRRPHSSCSIWEAWQFSPPGAKSLMSNTPIQVQTHSRTWDPSFVPYLKEHSKSILSGGGSKRILSVGSFPTQLGKIEGKTSQLCRSEANRKSSRCLSANMFQHGYDSLAIPWCISSKCPNHSPNPWGPPGL